MFLKALKTNDEKMAMAKRTETTNAATNKFYDWLRNRGGNGSDPRTSIPAPKKISDLIMDSESDPSFFRISDRTYLDPDKFNGRNFGLRKVLNTRPLLDRPSFQTS